MGLVPDLGPALIRVAASIMGYRGELKAIDAEWVSRCLRRERIRKRMSPGGIDDRQKRDR